MSATQDLIAAALALCDVAATDYEGAYRAKRDLREACARAMVQPAAPDMAEVERLADAYANAFFCTKPVIEIIEVRTALLDYVRGVLTERDQFRDAAKMVPDANDPDPLHLSRILHELAGAASMCWTPRPSTAVFDSQQALVFVEQAIAEIRQRMQMMSAAPPPVGEVKAVEGIPIPTGHAEADRIIGRLMSSDPDFQDCTDAAALIQREICGPDGFATWREAALAERIKRTPQPVSEVPMPEENILQISALQNAEVRWIDRKACLTYGDAREAAGYARGRAEAGRDAERYRWLRDVSVPPHNFYLSVPDEFAGVRYTPTEVDAAIEALRGEVKP